MTLEAMNSWYLASALLFAVEAFGLPGLGFFFAAIGALIVALLLQIGALAPEQEMAQFSIFCISTALSAWVLWKPFKNLLATTTSKNAHHDIIGRSARVAGTGLSKGQTGIAFWSGTTMQARLAALSTLDNVAAGTELIIVDMDGATLVLDRKE